MCRAEVDPRRYRRVGASLGLLVRPPGPGRVERSVWAAAWIYLVAAVLAAAVLWGFADRWWPATVLLFGPRWLLLVPVAALVPAVLWCDRLSLIPVLIAAGVVVGPVMGFSLPWQAVLKGADADGPELGIVTFNARGGEGLALGAAAMLAEWRADIAGFQECRGTLRRELLALRPATDGWHTAARASLCLASRRPIVAMAEMDREDFEFAGGSALVVTWSIAFDATDTVHITNLHLETPRSGLALVRRGQLRAGARLISDRSFLRDLELAQARRWVQTFVGPHLVVGDFNTPVESVAYRESWGEWRNAFSYGGFGLGGTRLNGWIRARIDHILVDRHWRVVSAGPIRDLGSDHLPMKAIVRPAFGPQLQDFLELTGGRFVP